MFSHIRRLPSSFSDSILEVIVIDVQMKKKSTQELNIVENVWDNIHNTTKNTIKVLSFG